MVVYGEFKQGKSSLLNAFLEEPGLFPVAVRVATNLVCTITYAPEETVTAYVGEQEPLAHLKQIENRVGELMALAESASAPAPTGSGLSPGRLI